MLRGQGLLFVTFFPEDVFFCWLVPSGFIRRDRICWLVPSCFTRNWMDLDNGMEAGWAARQKEVSELQTADDLKRQCRNTPSRGSHPINQWSSQPTLKLSPYDADLSHEEDTSGLGWLNVITSLEEVTTLHLFQFRHGHGKSSTLNCRVPEFRHRAVLHLYKLQLTLRVLAFCVCDWVARWCFKPHRRLPGIVLLLCGACFYCFCTIPTSLYVCTQDHALRKLTFRMFMQSKKMIITLIKICSNQFTDLKKTQIWFIL